MKNLAQRITVFIAVITTLAFVGIAVPTTVQAQQVNPTEQSVTEDQLFQSLQGDEMVTGRVSIPDKKSRGLIKPGNKSWAGTHTGSCPNIDDPFYPWRCCRAGGILYDPWSYQD